jgi:hypothetical protein
MCAGNCVQLYACHDLPLPVLGHWCHTPQQHVQALLTVSSVASCLQACPEQQLCRLLSKLTKGCVAGSQELAATAANPHLVAVLVRCCTPTDRKTCKRALQVRHLT